MPPKFRVLRGLNYPPGKRAEAGEVRDDLPTESIPWLLKAGAIEPVVAAAAERGRETQAVERAERLREVS